MCHIFLDVPVWVGPQFFRAHGAKIGEKFFGVGSEAFSLGPFGLSCPSESWGYMSGSFCRSSHIRPQWPLLGCFAGDFPYILRCVSYKAIMCFGGS